MEQQVLDLLAATLVASTPIRSDAERHLEQLYTNDTFPISLISIASHKSIALDHRQAALLSLKKLVLKTWSPSLEEYEGPETLSDATKERVRQSVLSIAIASDEERKIVAAASYVVSKIASADFPEQWPSLLPTLLNLVPQADATQLHGALLVLGSLVEDGFDEEQFSESAIDLVKCIYHVAVDGKKRLTTRALAVSIFRACLDTMELVYQTNKASVTQFMQELSEAWSPFFIEVLKMPLPIMPSEEEENEKGPADSSWRGVIALKTQVVKALDKIHNMFPQLLGPRTLELFSAIWKSLQAHLSPYLTMYTKDQQRQSRMDDADRLPYTLDYLVIEELDYIQTLLNTSIIKRELDVQLAPESMANGAPNNTWIQQILATAVGYSQILTEDEELWEVDINVFLSEETSETANYSARNACAGLATKLCNYDWPVLESLLAHSKTIFEGVTSNPKEKEAVLYFLKQVLEEVSSYERLVGPEIAQAYLCHIRDAMEDNGSEFLRARGFIAAGALITAPGKALLDLVPEFGLQSLKAIENDPSDIVKVSAMRVLQQYLKVLPAGRAQEFQVQTVAAISGFLSSHDLSEINDTEDLLDTLVETLRDAIMTDPTLCLEHPALDVLFTMASYGARSWQTSMLVNETFESITSAMSSKGPGTYARLCSKVLPSLTGALDVGDMTSENSLSDMAVSLLSTLAEYGSEPLPQGMVATLLPKLYRLLFLPLEFSVHQSATITIKYILVHDPAQLFAWRDPETGKEGLEIVLLIIDRLLGPEVDDSSAAEVGGLTVELVEKAGADRLGPYLRQLLQVVAIRLSTAERANIIQNLVLVFARLSLTNAKEVLDFLAQVQVEGANGGTGLEVVLRKWLENSVNFSGYDAIRQNVIALTNIYQLHDERLSNIQTKGDLIVQNSSRIKTRSQSKREPDQFSILPVPLKLTKVLIQELVNSYPSTPGYRGRNHSLQGGISDDEDDAWEDEPTILDLGAQATRQDLMGYMDESKWNTHETDDATQKYLVDFFNTVSNEPGFQELYHCLTDAEREKLPSISKIEGHNWRHGDIEDMLKTVAFIKGHKWTSMMIKRVYFGNWLRDYSQAMDVGSLKGIQAGTVRILVWILSPEEHIDNPKDYADNVDARNYDERLRPPVQAFELEVDPRTGMKNYIANEDLDIATSAGYVRFSFTRSIHFGRVYTSGASGTKGKEADLCEALRCLGQGLHCLEDFGAHTNYTELALREMGFQEVFPHTGSTTEINVPGAQHPVFPLVTGTFGVVDFLHSVLGEATDHFAQSEVEQMDIALKDAEARSKVSDDGSRGFNSSQGLSTMTSLLSQLPGTADLARQAADLQAMSDVQERTTAGPPFGSDVDRKFAGPPGSQDGPPGPNIPGTNIDPMKTAAQIYPILEFRDRVVKLVNATIEKIPGLEALVEKISETLTLFVLSLLAPFIRPIINAVSAQLKAGSGGIIDASGKHQYEPWTDRNCSDPTHSLLSKDHFSNILNEPAGQVASTILKYVAPRILFAWQQPDIPVEQVLNDVVRVFHHPALRRSDCELHQNMFSAVESWVRSRPDGGSNLNVLLGSESVRHGRNHTVDASQQSHSHGGLPSPNNFFGSASQSKVRDAPWDQIGKARGVNRPSPRPSPQPSPRPDFGYHPQQDLQSQQQNPYEEPAYLSDLQQEPQMYGQLPQWQPAFQASSAGQYPPQEVFPHQPPAYGYGQAPPYGYDPNTPPSQAYDYGGPPLPGKYCGGGPY
ncbi:MAG: hypothetical protein ALECFALPRED_007664 [Alectoria fallacina]|uniref:Importin N-terminal domain-containing protein n=1 Tax=Alectoria fallacina TaxID=1903189 RepID=A0A8H3ET92_9LECA|nr:MAG: hypothetical protein ALECFALPRED_007664 [Alectoria fallacina]